MSNYDSSSSSSSDKGSNASRQPAEFWYDDGNVIIQTIEKSTRTHRSGVVVRQTEGKSYRVHRSVLSKHSTFFADMFTVPQPPSQEKCSTVPVTDQAEEWDLLLAVMYGSRSLREPVTGLLSIEMLRALLRLGQKYDFTKYKQEALDQLTAIMPSTLSAWDRLFAEGPREQQLRVFGKKHAIQLLQLAQDRKIMRCLPMAYFHCLHVRQSFEIVQGKDPQDLHTTSRAGLSSTTKHKLLLAKEKIRNRIFTRTFRWWHDGVTIHTCKTQRKCKTALGAVQRHLRCEENPAGVALDPIAQHRGYIAALCPACKTFATKMYNDGRKELFDELPLLILGVDGWEELVDDYW